MESCTNIVIDIAAQQLVVEINGVPHNQFTISTARNGTGFEPSSYKTPTGRFEIAEKIGGDCPLFTVFRARKPVGIWPHELPEDISPDSDLVLTRILWLDGMDQENKSTYARYIYIHGTNHEERLGSPDSCGCIRLSNTDMVTLYNLVEKGTTVVIRE